VILLSITFVWTTESREERKLVHAASLTATGDRSTAYFSESSPESTTVTFDLGVPELVP
jgi:hypothetical protein